MSYTFSRIHSIRAVIVRVAAFGALLGLALPGCGEAGPARATLLEPVTAELSVVVERPFTFALTGHASPDFSQGPCNVTNVESGMGNALHLGEVTWSSEETVDFCVDPDDPSLGRVTGSWTISAANGDRLDGTYQTVVRADFVAGTLSATGDYVVTGGDGRFAAAGGEGIVSVTGSLAPPFDVTGTFSGSVVY